MSLPQLFDEYGAQVHLTPHAAEDLKGSRLPGGTVTQFSGKKWKMYHFCWETNHQIIHLRTIQQADIKSVTIQESVPGLRFEAALKGELRFGYKTGEEILLQQGEYHITRHPKCQISLPRKTGCEYIVVYLSDAMLRDFGEARDTLISGRSPLTSELSGVLREILHNPFKGNLRTVYYRKLISDILFFHLAGRSESMHHGLSEADLEAVRRADAILSADLAMHYKIPELCAMTGTNEYKLKRGFRLLFNMGMFARLLQKRMDHAKFLLSTTGKSIRDIAYETGYDTHAGFITAFRKRYGKTPLEWRNNSR